jgi:RHS repeat-associated protein
VIEQLGLPVKSLNYFGLTLEQENENGSPVRQISVDTNSGVPVAYHSNFGTQYTLFDARYNLVRLANTNGELVESFEYDSFGVPTIKDSSGTTMTSSNFGVDPIFGGLRFLSTSQIYLSIRRMMNPSTGVFLAQDSKAFVDSASLYVYSRQNPVSNLDLLGEQSMHEESPTTLKHTQEHHSHTPHIINAVIKTTMEFFEMAAHHGFLKLLLYL